MQSEKSCGNCKFWGSRTDFLAQGEYKPCGALKDDSYRERPSDEIAYTVAYEESALMTKARFGCVLFEVKK
jgi:hypothetical protein